MTKPDCDEQPGFFLNLKFRECEKSLIEPVRARVSPFVLNYLSMVASRSGPREMILIGTFR